LQEAQPLQKSEAKLVKKTKSRKTQEDQPLQKAKLIFFQKRNKTLKILHRKVKPKYFKKKQNPKNRKGFSFHKKKTKQPNLQGAQPSLTCKLKAVQPL
jgi:hypothetical protein